MALVLIFNPPFNATYRLLLANLTVLLLANTQTVVRNTVYRWSGPEVEGEDPSFFTGTSGTYPVAFLVLRVEQVATMAWLSYATGRIH